MPRPRTVPPAPPAEPLPLDAPPETVVQAAAPRPIGRQRKVMDENASAKRPARTAAQQRRELASQRAAAGRRVAPLDGEIATHADRLRAAAKMAVRWSLWARPAGGQRSFLCYTNEPTQDFIARTYGGGDYDLWKQDRATGEQLGDPIPFSINTDVHPPRLSCFQNGLEGPWGRPQGFNGFNGQPAPFLGLPGSLPAAPAAETAKQLAEAQDELEDLEEENEALKRQLTVAQDEARQVKADAERERQEAARAQERAEWKRELEALANAMKGNKDPLDQMLQFKRIESELNGGPLAQGARPDPLAQAVTLMGTLMTMAKEMPKAGDSDRPGSGLESMAEIFKSVAPLIAQAGTQTRPEVIQLGPPAGAPPPAPAAPVAPSPAPAAEPGPPPEFVTALKGLAEGLAAEFEKAGTPLAGRDWIVAQDGPGWKDLKAVIVQDDPQNFVDYAASAMPTLVDTDHKKAWVIEALNQAKIQLKG